MSQSNQSAPRIVIAPLVGNILEFYTITLFLFLAPAFADVFFVAENRTAQLMIIYAIVGFTAIARPLGALFFGHLGDRIGRKKTLSATVILLAVTSIGYACLPTYATAGKLTIVIAATLSALAIFSLGGEAAGTAIYIIENAPENRRGFYGSWMSFTLIVGSILSSLIASFFSQSRVVNEIGLWAWRTPFLIGSLIGFFGLYLRLFLRESPIFDAAKQAEKIYKYPVVAAFKQSKYTILSLILLSFYIVSSYIFVIQFYPVYINTYFHIPLSTLLLFSAINMFIYLLLAPLFGFLSDKVGRKTFLIASACLGCISYFLFLLLQGNMIWIFFFVQTILIVSVSGTFAVYPAVLVESFPTSIRYTAAAVSNAIGSIFGLFTPLIATSLIAKTGSIYASPIYFSVLSFLVLLVLIKLKETRTRSLSSD